MKKRIAVCGNGWSNEYLEIAMSGIRRCAKEQNVDVFWLLNFSSGVVSEENSTGDFNINRLVEYGEFDGVILLSNTFHLQSEFEYFTKFVNDRKIPAVSLEYHLPGIDFWGSDNYSGMKELAEHLIFHHGCEDIVFISGPKGNAESDTRCKALQDVMAKKNLTLDEDHVICCNWNYHEVQAKLPAWIASYGKLPDVFVCANDVMAMAVCATMDEMCYKVPDDVKVTGFDYLLSVRTYRPTIASVDRNWDNMSYQSMQYLLRRIERKTEREFRYVDSKAVPAESCGCEAQKNLPDYKRIRENGAYAGNVNNSFWSGHLCDITENVTMSVSEAEFHKSMSEYFESDHRYEGENFSICLMDNFFSSLKQDGDPLSIVGYTAHMQVICRLKDGKAGERVRFATKELVPEYDGESDEGKLYILLPLYVAEAAFGYVVFEEEIGMIYDYSVYNWTRSVSQNLNRVRKNIVIEELNSRLEKLSVTDSLTGVYNRFGCEKVAYPYLEKCHEEGKTAILMFADVNKMKGINDKFGHLQGDTALCTVAHTLQETLGESYIVVRYGGDEFLMVGEDIDTRNPEVLMKQIEENLQKNAAKMQLPYELNVSVGYVTVKADEELKLTEYLKKADEAMYEMKHK
mgnify:CR=1 FL=1